jgi:hypothetical protein
LVIARRIFEAFDTPAETVGQPHASKVRHSLGEAISLIILVGYYDPVSTAPATASSFPRSPRQPASSTVGT